MNVPRHATGLLDVRACVSAIQRRGDRSCGTGIGPLRLLRDRVDVVFEPGREEERRLVRARQRGEVAEEPRRDTVHVATGASSIDAPTRGAARRATVCGAIRDERPHP